MLFQRRDAENAERSAEKTKGNPKTQSGPLQARRFLLLSCVFSALPLRSLRLCVELNLASCELQEVADDLQADGAGFFGVELDAVDVAAFERGGVADFIGAGGAGTRVLGHVVAVREVDVGARVEIANRSEEHTSELQSPCNLVC